MLNPRPLFLSKCPGNNLSATCLRDSFKNSSTEQDNLCANNASALSCRKRLCELSLRYRAITFGSGDGHIG